MLNNKFLLEVLRLSVFPWCFSLPQGNSTEWVADDMHDFLEPYFASRSKANISSYLKFNMSWKRKFIKQEKLLRFLLQVFYCYVLGWPEDFLAHATDPICVLIAQYYVNTSPLAPSSLLEILPSYYLKKKWYFFFPRFLHYYYHLGALLVGGESVFISLLKLRDLTQTSSL